MQERGSMHNPAKDQDIHRIFASIDNIGTDAPTAIMPFAETEKTEEFDVYVEEDRITVVKRPEPKPQVKVVEVEAVKPPQQQIQPQPSPLFASIALTLSLLLLSYLVTSAFITDFFPPTITVTILTKSQTVTATGTLQLQGRVLPGVTLRESQTVPATGIGHQNARAATGAITFYNGLFTPQVVQAGTILTGADGVHIITGEEALIPAANPPSLGRATVPAHALTPGSSGNIPSYDINLACCATAIKAANADAFQGGADARDFAIVTKEDITTAEGALTHSLVRSMQGALNAQARQNETLLALPCSGAVSPNHQAGDAAKDVTVTVSETCSAVAYNRAALEERVTAFLASLAAKKPGPGYSLRGVVQVSIKQATATRTTTPLVFLTFQAQGTWGYTVTKEGEQRIKQLIVGMRKQEALRKLLSQPGILEASIVGIDDLAKLPKSVSSIHLVIIA